MLNNFKKVNVDSAKAIKTAHLNHHLFNRDLNAAMIEVLTPFVGKKITRKIHTAVKAMIDAKFPGKVRWASYEKDPSFGDRVSIEIRCERDEMGDEHTIYYYLTNSYRKDETFRLEEFIAESPSLRNVDRWISEVEADIENMNRVAVRWNNIMDLLEGIEKDMDCFPHESYNKR